ncbi:putative phage-type endonuclease [Lentzea xinjiangensis]|uniref:Putative phage-type endonuclease n=1 Tax=Lentzea xinjiangensis TaxID=402600 RepID=A0A1H9THD3_9PSEU|nr:YqaJ viral recombinase family protein [Lentzea xinjiangensis]SER96023.1 putative phage-type endonuclease [Lentzea xinjiangensis]
MTLGIAEHVGAFEAGSPEWHAARANAITGSRIAAVMGFSPWESRFSLWHRMAGMVSDEVENDLMRWGKLLEPVILGEYARQHDAELNTRPGTWRNSLRPWQVANVDALGPRIVEAKYSPMTEGWGEQGTDQIPIYYRAQCLWYLDTFGGPAQGFERVDLAVFFGVTGYAEYHVDYSADECRLMRNEARAFLDTLPNGESPGVRPDIDAHSSTWQTVRELHPDIDDEAIEVTDDVAVPYLKALTALATAEEEKARASGVLLDAMGRARRAVHNGQQIAMRIPGRGDKPPYLKHTPKKAPGQKVSRAA